MPTVLCHSSKPSGRWNIAGQMPLCRSAIGLVRLTQQRDGVADRQLGDGVAIAARRVEDLQPAAVEVRQVEAIHADRADGDHAQLTRFGQ